MIAGALKKVQYVVGTTRTLHPAARNLLYSQLVFFSGLAICLLLAPQGWLINHGISFFGTTRATIIPYSAAFLLADLYTIKAAHALPQKPPYRALRRSLLSLGVFIPGLVATPYTLGSIYGTLHVVFGSAIFVLQLTLTIWLALFMWRDRINSFWLVLQFIGGLIAYYALDDRIIYSLQGQLLFQIAFGVIIVRTVQLLQPAAAINS